MADDWVDFVEEFGPLVYASSWRILKDRQEAEDITQDVFAFAWSQPSDHVRNMAGWLRQIAVRRSLDRLRQRRPLVNSELDLQIVDDRTTDALEVAELEEAVRTAVAALPDQQSVIFALRYFEEMSNREIAEHLAISTTAVSSSLHAARTALASVLTPYIYGEAK